MRATVAALRRYPIKSMLGEERSGVEVGARGLAGDRALAVVHARTGFIASAKNPRLWRGLLSLRAEVAASAVRITLPDGGVVRHTDADVDTRLSEVVGQPVLLVGTPPPDAALERADPDSVLRAGITAQVDVVVNGLAAAAPQGTFFDFAPVHLLTTATLDRVAALSPSGSADPARYRPNIVVGTPGKAGFVENDWLGRTLRIGGDLVLRVVARTPRCAVPTLDHGDLPRDPAALRVLADHNRVVPLEPLTAQPCAGVYAQVLQPGAVHTGDPVLIS